MLSAAKVRIHGMQDENWVIKDKINQYRGLIKLYGKRTCKSCHYISNFLLYWLYSSLRTMGTNYAGQH